MHAQWREEAFDGVRMYLTPLDHMPLKFIES